eukprot:10144369-Alexandrium_andersonii.AAC.1
MDAGNAAQHICRADRACWAGAPHRDPLWRGSRRGRGPAPAAPQHVLEDTALREALRGRLAMPNT